MIGKVLRMHHREKNSVREIVRATSLTRNTVRKYLRTPPAQPPKYRRKAAMTKLGPFVETVKMALAADARRPRKERRTAKALLQQLVEAGYEGGYTQLTDFIRAWRAQQGGVAVGKAFVPLAFELGEAFQFDWSEEALVIGGIYRKLQVAHMKLCASRAFWLVAYPSQGHEMLFDAHTRSFAALGGVARRGIYDNMRTAVEPRPVTHRALHRRPDAYIFDINLWFLPIGVHLLVTNAWLPAKRPRPAERPGTAGYDRLLLAVHLRKAAVNERQQGVSQQPSDDEGRLCARDQPLLAHRRSVEADPWRSIIAAKSWPDSCRP